MTTMMKTFLVVLLLTLTLSEAFVPAQSRHAVASRSNLFMAPKYDKASQKWTPSKPEEGPEAGYPPINTLLLHGPKPFLQRVFTPDDYEQAVLKYMSGDKCSRDIAQGNMDAYLRSKFGVRRPPTKRKMKTCYPFVFVRLTHVLSYAFNPSDPQDWAANRMEEQTRDFKVDYVTLKPTKVALTVAWSFVVFGYAGFAITHWPTP
jgi:hypothetical protein